jgi:hypothetical protein
LNDSHTIINSIIVDGLVTLEDDVTLRNNCYWNTRGKRIGEEVEIKFADVANMDYTLISDGHCHGTRVASVEQLFNSDEGRSDDE